MERIRALDGLRALAIIMVIGYHIDKSVVPAGYWGVPVFLVLSGYLITRLLSDEIDREGRVDLRRFYAKRAARLLPALLVICLVLVAAGTAWSMVAPTLGYYANYARIAGADLGLLTHTWFLAVVAHFYILWPLVIGGMPARHRLRIVGLLALAAVAWRVIAIGVMSPGWVYNATDTNAAAILVGCYLGVARPKPWRKAGWSIPLLLTLILLPVFGEEGQGFLWGGFIALALGVMAVQYAVSRPRWLETPAVVWLGTVSYGLYLWHYVFLRIDLPLGIALSLSLAVTAASWYLIEKPVMRWVSRLDRRSRRRETSPPAEHARELAGASSGRG
jgi:peptidoglycan/LPS O-acetylase OafA/YrhL